MGSNKPGNNGPGNRHPHNQRPLKPGGGGPTGYTGGTNHKSSSVEGTPLATLVYSIAGGVVLTLGSVIAYLAHGYGAF